MSAFSQTATNDLTLAWSTTRPGTTTLFVVDDPAICAAMKIRNRLRFWLGTWFADKRLGVPWLSSIFVTNPSRSVVKRILDRTILSVPFISTVTSAITFDPASRRGSYTFTAKTSTGRTITGGSNAPFIVDGLEVFAPSTVQQATAT